jgi:hypothetical protein
VPAERLAALRIGLAAVLLLDVLFSYWPHRHDFFGRESLGDPVLFSWRIRWNSEVVAEDLHDLPEDIVEHDPFQQTLAQRWRWSLLKEVEDPTVIHAAMLAWIAGIVCLLFGLCTRSAAVIVWVLSTSFATINNAIDNAGDEIRYIMLFYLMVCPAGAVWSIDAWLGRRFGVKATRAIGGLAAFAWACLVMLLVLQLVPTVSDLAARLLLVSCGVISAVAVWAWWVPRPLRGRIFVYPWALRLLFVQLIFIYFCNGLFKATGADWNRGDSLYYVLGDLTLTRWSFAQFHLPYWLTKLFTHAVLIWEVGFPFLVVLPWVLANWLEQPGNRYPVSVLWLIIILGLCCWIGWVYGDSRLWKLVITSALWTLVGGLWYSLLWLKRRAPLAIPLLATTLRLIVVLTLSFGVAFHLGIGLSMELGGFVPYILCMYLPLLPWERLRVRPRSSPLPCTRGRGAGGEGVITGQTQSPSPQPLSPEAGARGYSDNALT